jgi:hypothetical protein
VRVRLTAVVTLLGPGRRDDLWSWLYIMVEMITGTLPWRSDEGRNREQVRRHAHTAGSRHAECMVLPRLSLCNCQAPFYERSLAVFPQVVRLKRESLADPSRLSAGMVLPAPLARASTHLASLSFEADPDYALLRQCLDDLVSDVRVPVEMLVGFDGKCHGTCAAVLG